MDLGTELNNMCMDKKKLISINYYDYLIIIIIIIIIFFLFT